ncbi:MULTISPECIES: hypothetical protein [unclassified Coleofasciculus]|uniref:hypothetical protein n=1 Tax=unclassified Coleofasciculus TaxID=2692782 RepID=UPI00187F0BDC|nr:MULTISPECIES: hypothetical protein [unclassified Coleofasciculus]MBE9127404.1 hypothetical protein [Coleofasciculus sp. LEGE 07081]MBE9147170.1 hypothetical protein [Coleofasciculus sp. LEGE 07092]
MAYLSIEPNFLTINPKDNCYVIPTWQMENLQNQAKSITLNEGTYNIQIADGYYSYAKATTKGEPFVLLWIYGMNGSTFVNKTSGFDENGKGFETGATWTTLNGKKDILTLQVKEEVVLCGLFFDVNKENNDGEVTLSITKENDPSFQVKPPFKVKSKENCYVFNEKELVGLRRGENYKELPPGTHLLQITRGSDVSYWSENQKFDLEPWALLWVKDGKFSTEETGVTVEETWCSLNGYDDRVLINVEETTTLCGLFFDTYKEDNEGKIILSKRVLKSPQNPSLQPRPIPVAINFDDLWNTIPRNPQQDIICVSPVRTVVRREEEIILIRKVRKVEEIEASPACPVNSTEMSPVEQDGQTKYTEKKNAE